MIARSVPKGSGDRPALRPPLPGGRALRPPDRLQLRPAGRQRVREVPQRRAGRRTSPSSARSSTSCAGATQEGNDIVTNIDPDAQRVALDELAAGRLRRRGRDRAAARGRVRVMASNPPYDPNRVPERPRRAERTDPNAPLLNRATQGQYPPGSTFKVVTAAAGLDSGTITPGHDDRRARGSSTSRASRCTTTSTRTSAPIAPRHGADQLGQHLVRPARPAGRRGRPCSSTWNRFGFNSKPPIDLPSDQVYDERHLRRRRPARRRATRSTSARVAIGQERLLVTPLQMAEVAAAVANGGTLMKPQIWDRVVDPDGRVDQAAGPVRVQPSRSSEETAAELTTAMEGVVSEGTGTNAAIPGVTVAGKTGTAETPFNEACGGGIDAEPGLVHRLRPGRRPADRDRGDGRVHARVRRRRRGADLPRRRGSDPERRMTLSEEEARG